MLGCLLSIPTMTLLGRRGAALYVMTVAYLLGYLLIGFAVNVEMIIIGNYDKILMITHISPPHRPFKRTETQSHE